MKRYILIISAMLSPLLITSCMDIKQEYQPTEFYTLEYEAPDPSSKEQLPFSIRTERFSTAPDLNSGRIIYRSGPHKRAAYVYHRWRSNPADTVRYLLTRDLSASGLFSAVVSDTGNLHSTIAIEGLIDEFYEWDNGQDTEAVISISIIVSADTKDTVDRDIILQENFSSRKPCIERSAPALVEAMSKAMAEISDNLTTRIYQELSKPKINPQ